MQITRTPSPIESMTSFIALLRAVNVGGTGKLPMSDLKEMCESAGFRCVRTYIASGNVIFESKLDETAVRKALEKRLLAYAGKPVAVMVRTARKWQRCWRKIRFRMRQASYYPSFSSRLLRDALDSIFRTRRREVNGRNEIYVVLRQTWHGRS